MMIEVSVIICSHNLRPDYFKRALDSLRGQALAQEKWELSLVDNTSQKPLSRESDLSWQNNAQLLLESELGLAPARRAGMCATAADLLVSVDDGNVLDLRYLKEALRIKNGRPDLGVWRSGAIVPKFERQLSAHVEVLLSYLALQETAEPRWDRPPLRGGRGADEKPVWPAEACFSWCVHGRRGKTRSQGFAAAGG